MQALSIPLLINTEQADKLISCGSGDAALLFIHILRNSGNLDAQKAIMQLSFSPERYRAALDTLTELSLIERTAPPEPAPEPTYHAPDISKTMDNEKDFRSLVSDTERRLGKPLSRSDLEKLLYMYDELALPPDVLAILITYCFDIVRKRYGESRSLRMSFVQKVASEWAELGIRDCETAENYVQRRKQLQSATTKTARLLGIGSRQLSASEEKYITSWLESGFGSEEIEHAYDITVLRTGALTWTYMNAVLRNWAKKGLHTLAAIQAAESAGTKKIPPRPASAPPGESELQAIAQMRRYAAKRRENGGDAK